MNQILKKFVIKGLYGERDVHIEFRENFLILVAENGYGKTTVLNALFATLSGDAKRLRKIDFSSIELTFADGLHFKLEKSDLKYTMEALKKLSPLTGHILNTVGEKSLNELLEIAFTTSRALKDVKEVKEFANLANVPHSYFLNMLEEFKTSGFSEKATRILKKIRTSFPYNLVYLPTYRRVEQDFKDLSLESQMEKLEDHAINFGMRDVDLRFKEITKEITSSSVEWFSKVNGEMLTQLVHGFHVDEATRNSVRDEEAIKIVLDRIGSNIREDAKREILRLVETGAIFEGHDHEPLLYFVANLLKVYEQQKNNDKAIQDFSEVCNRYLVDKMIKYDESKVTIEIVRRKNGIPVDIEHLSSGEKQIISLFARLYLKKETELAIFFDEPELSLSIEWQKTILPDIINSGKCAFLFVTTHSPFIFENELIGYTADLRTFIREL